MAFKFLFIFLFLWGLCMRSEQEISKDAPASTDRLEEFRRQMVEQQIKARGVSDPRVLDALLKVPRHLFVPENQVEYAYEDTPLPIGYAQTISQPYIVAYMTEMLGLKSDDKVLEIGTGSGYQAAILAELCRDVYTIEVLAPLYERATHLLEEMGYKNIYTKVGDGFQGWPEAAPFDAIMVTAAPENIPPPLLEQLNIGGRLIIPVGDAIQQLVLVTKKDHQTFHRKSLIPVRFVPMTGEAERKK